MAYIEIIKHLFGQSDKYQLPCSGPRCDQGAPCTTEAVPGKAVTRAPNTSRRLHSRMAAEPAPGLTRPPGIKNVRFGSKAAKKHFQKRSSGVHLKAVMEFE